MNYLFYIFHFFTISAYSIYYPSTEGPHYHQEPSAKEYIYFWDHVFKATPDEVEELWDKLFGIPYMEWRIEFADLNGID